MAPPSFSFSGYAHPAIIQCVSRLRVECVYVLVCTSYVSQLDNPVKSRNSAEEFFSAKPAVPE